VQVLDHQQQWAALGEPVQHPEQQLEQPTRHERASPGHGLDPRLDRGAELGHQAGQLGAGSAEHPLQLSRVHGSAERPQRLHHRRVGDHPLAHVQAAPGEPKRRLCAHPAEQLGHQPGLANASLARYHHRGGRARLRTLEGRPELSVLGGAADEHRAGNP
jgi:hypothetical protein